MRLLPLLALALASPALAQSPETEVIAAVTALLRVLETGDVESVSAHLDSTTRFTLLRPGPAGTRVVVLTGSQFLQSITGPRRGAMRELIRNPEVRIDGDLATVWTEYQFQVDGVVSHCGVNAVHLARIGGVWKLMNLSDSFRREDCGDPWPGSP